MSVAVLVTWGATVLVGLFLFATWLMEYDPESQGAAATRLPVPVISAHALLGVGGLMLWGVYLVADVERLAWATVAALGVGAVLGLFMVVRWIGVYRASANPTALKFPELWVPVSGFPGP